MTAETKPASLMLPPVASITTSFRVSSIAAAVTWTEFSRVTFSAETVIRPVVVDTGADRVNKEPARMLTSLAVSRAALKSRFSSACSVIGKLDAATASMVMLSSSEIRIS